MITVGVPVKSPIMITVDVPLKSPIGTYSGSQCVVVCNENSGCLVCNENSGCFCEVTYNDYSGCPCEVTYKDLQWESMCGCL